MVTNPAHFVSMCVCIMVGCDVTTDVIPNITTINHLSPNCCSTGLALKMPNRTCQRVGEPSTACGLSVSCVCSVWSLVLYSSITKNTKYNNTITGYLFSSKYNNSTGRVALHANFCTRNKDIKSYALLTSGTDSRRCSLGRCKQQQHHHQRLRAPRGFQAQSPIT